MTYSCAVAHSYCVDHVCNHVYTAAPTDVTTGVKTR